MVGMVSAFFDWVGLIHHFVMSCHVMRMLVQCCHISHAIILIESTDYDYYSGGGTVPAEFFQFESQVPVQSLTNF